MPILLISQKTFREFRISGRPVALGKIDENWHCSLGVLLCPVRPCEVIAHIAFRTLPRATSTAPAFAQGLIAALTRSPTVRAPMRSQLYAAFGSLHSCCCNQGDYTLDP